jgi:predicted transport protein
MLFRNVKGKLEFISGSEFKLESELQKLIDGNLTQVFGFTFIKDQFVIEGEPFRLDTVAYDPNANAFVIIEYKNIKNASLVDQGYTYLQVLLKRKADFVLLYNEQLKATKTVKDFDWSQSRIVFVSPKFTDYQKRAATFEDMPFTLFEVSRYDNDIIAVNAVGKVPVRIDQVSRASGVANTPTAFDVVGSEIEVYTEEMHLAKGSEVIRDLYERIKEAFLSWGDITVDVKKIYIAFKVQSNFTDITIQNKALKIFINLRKGELNDPQELARDISTTGHHGNGDYQVQISTDDDLEYVLSLIKQAYKKQKP